jgi:predicted HTH domain antitoxin
LRAIPDELADAPLGERVGHLYECEQLSTYQVARIVGMDRQRVGRLLRQSGIALKPRGAGRKRLPDARVETVADLYTRARLSTTEIAALTGVPSRTIRDWLRARGVPMRTRGRMNREDRQAAPAEALIELYVRSGLSAAETGRLLGMSHHVVLRTAHDLGLPVRTVGPAPRRGPAEIELIDALYADPAVRQVLARNNITAIPAGGSIWERFPARLPLSPELAADLYVGCGLSARHIELISGVPGMTVRKILSSHGVTLRGPGGRSPFMRRWRCGSPAGRPAAGASRDREDQG